MKILITGATGFLGSRLLRTLLHEGHDLTILKRSCSDTRRIHDILSQIKAYNLDTCGSEQIFTTAGTFDTIIHTATCYGRAGESAAEILEANVVFPLRLLQAASSSCTTTFLNTDSSLAPNLNFYALSKKQFRDWGEMFARRGSIRFVNIKLEHFFGAGDDDSKFITHIIRSCLQNVPDLQLTPGEQRRDFIHIEDVCSAYLLLLQKAVACGESFQEFELGLGNPVTIREIVEMIHRLTGSSTTLNFGGVPYRENEVMESGADVSALAALGWTPKIRLPDGIRQTIELERTNQFALKGKD
ncbi:NAD-dependent epimerase/dehydratase family protein [Geotalea toluenoxydans]|uniref:NAD-dependent epimerase/dehydratase family protein n=1 Tax=Geotalea toluenoxydans TaxID=421624 RepID=UPI0006CFAFF3|nr:NAD(P)-dependent oxidoreductase [Geotalea toluenoxydans]